MVKKLLFILILLTTMFLIGFEGYRQGYKARSNNSIVIGEEHKHFQFTTHLPNGMIYKGEGSSGLDQLVLQDGYYEPETIEVLHRIVKFIRNNFKDNHNVTFLDIGANVGNHTLAMATEVDHVISVEPYPPILKRLHDHIQNNNLSNVEVLEVGFGKASDKLKFAPPPDSDIGIGTFSSDVFNNQRRFHKYHKSTYEKSDLFLDIVRGDDVLGERLIDMIKLDIEGYERFALEGLQNTVRRSNPAIVMELNRNQDGGFTSEQQLRELLPPDYSIYFINDKPAEACVAPIGGKWEEAHQLVLLPKRMEALGTELVDKDCLSIFANIIYPFIHQIRLSRKLKKEKES